MDVDAQNFKRGAVRPIVCLREGWHLLAGHYWLFLGITFVGIIVASLGPLGILMGPAFCGIHYCLFRRERGKRVSFDMLFRGFDYFAPSLIATLIMMVPMLGLILISYLLFIVGMLGTMAAMPQPAPGQPLDPNVLLIFVLLTSLYVLAITGISVLFNLAFFFVYPLIVDRGLSGWEAIKLSIRGVFNNFFGVLGIIILTQILAMLGVLACYVGVIFVLPITFAMTSIAYQQVFGTEESYAEFPREFDEPEPDLEPRATGPIVTGIQGTTEA